MRGGFLRPLRSGPNYGIDDPYMFYGLFLLGGLLFAVAAYFIRMAESLETPFAIPTAFASGLVGVGVLTLASMLGFDSGVSKPRQAELVVKGLPWAGDEMVLDVGCGRGLMLVKAAKRLGEGLATGIDLWKRSLLFGNSPRNVLRNASTEGTDRIELSNADVRSLPVRDNFIDVVFSAFLSLHVRRSSERKRVVEEMVRVLKPGGQIRLIVTSSPEETLEVLRASRLKDITVSKVKSFFLAPVSVVSARKPFPIAKLEI